MWTPRCAPTISETIPTDQAEQRCEEHFGPHHAHERAIETPGVAGASSLGDLQASHTNRATPAQNLTMSPWRLVKLQPHIP